MNRKSLSSAKASSPFGGTHLAPLTARRLHISVRDTGPMAQVAAMPNSAPLLIAAFDTAGLDLPAKPGVSIRSANGTLAHCQRPGGWLVELADTPLPALDPATGSITNLGQARASFAFKGEDAVELAQKLAPIDFAHPRHGPMSFVQSGSDHSVSIALWREAEDCFVVYVERSLARDFWHTLEAESSEFRT